MTADVEGATKSDIMPGLLQSMLQEMGVQATVEEVYRKGSLSSMRADITGDVNWAQLVKPDLSFFTGCVGGAINNVENTFRSARPANTASPTSERLAEVLPRLLHNNLEKMAKMLGGHFQGYQVQV